MLYKYLLRRLGDIVLTLLGVVVVVFLVLRLLPGNAITGQYGLAVVNLSPAAQASLRAYFGLNKPLPAQFLSWLGSVARGNFGVQMATGKPVSGLIASALPVTVELALLAALIGIVIGIPLGIFAASRVGRPSDALCQGGALFGLGVPDFVLATGLVWLLSAQFGYFPSAGSYVSVTTSPLANLQQQIFPALVLGCALSANVMRTTRSAYLDQASQDFVRTARGKGVPPMSVRWRHILRNAAIPIVTINGIQLGYLLGGTIVVEEVFGLPGMGSLLLTGIEDREYAVVQSVVLVIAAMFLIVNLVVDLVYARIDPRVSLK